MGTGSAVASAGTVGVAVAVTAGPAAGVAVADEVRGPAAGSSLRVVGVFAQPIATLKTRPIARTIPKKRKGVSERRCTSLCLILSFVRTDPKKFPYARAPMKRKPKLTKRERKEAAGGPRPSGAKPQGHSHGNQHIHCIACGKHLNESDFEAPATATTITCDHGSTFPTCVKCMPKSMALVKEHDETNQPVKVASAWH